MAGFADAFSAENVSKLMADPRLLMGLQLLQQSGPQPGNPSGGQRLGAAGLGAMQQIAQQQHSQQLQQYRQSMIAAQQAELAQRQQTAQQKVDEQRQWQQRLQDPTFLASLGPMARQMAQLGVDPSDLIRATTADNLAQHRQAQLQQRAQQFEQRQANVGTGGADRGPKVPTPRQILDEPLGDGMIQRHVFDATTNDYKPYGKPFRQYAPPKAGPLDALMGDIMPDDNSDAGPAVSGLPGSNVSMAPTPQGAELLMQGGGTNPAARSPATPMIAGGANPLAAREGMRVPGQPKPATPMTKAEYDALPTGAQYVDPVSGKIATKKAR